MVHRRSCLETLSASETSCEPEDLLIPQFCSAPVFRRDLHEEAVGIPEIDRRAAGIGLIRISRFGVRKLAVDFVSEAFGSNPIHMVDRHCEMCDHALLCCH